MLLIMAIDDKGSKEYNIMKESIELGGHCNINGKPVADLETLKRIYKKKK